jgi:hypothetical protein
MRFMRKSANSAALRERARELGVRPPSYSIPAAQAEVQTSKELREAAAEIVDQLDKRQGAEDGGGAPEVPSGVNGVSDVGSEATVEAPDAKGEKGRRSGRGKANPRVIRLHI